MPKFEVRLESPEGLGRRVMTLSAPTEAEAVALCVMREREHVAYTYDGDIYLTDDQAEEISSGLAVDDDGEIVAIGGGSAPKIHRAKFQQATQSQVFEVKGVRVVELDVDRLVNELRSLQHDEKAWKRILGALKDDGTPLAAVTGGLYGVPMKNQYDGTAVVDWDTDTIKCSLHTAYSFNQDTHDFWDDVSGTETSGTGYTTGGATLGSKTATYDTGTDQTRLDAADVSLTTSTVSATDAVVYKSTGTASTSPLVGAIDFGATVATTAGTFAVTFDSTGIVVLDVT